MPYKESDWTWHLKMGDGANAMDLGYWAEKEGGGVDSEDATYSDWDGDLVLGGKRTREDITLRKAYREQVHAVFRQLDARAGNGTLGACTITGTPVGDDGVSWGSPIVVTGVLKSVNPPDSSKGSSDAAKLEVVIKCNTQLA
jgi:hypothetical protein